MYSMDADVYVCMNTYVCIRMYVYVCMYVCVCMCMYVCIRMYVCVCMYAYACMCVCVCVCMQICMSSCMNVIQTHYVTLTADQSKNPDCENSATNIICRMESCNHDNTICAVFVRWSHHAKE